MNETAIETISPLPSETRLLFHKSERLRHKNLVDGLFEHGSRTTVYPLRVFWRALTEEELKKSFRCGVPDRIGPLQVIITVPKRKLHHAVDRVKMRRRIRETYRLLRIPLREAVQKNPDIRTLCIGIIYSSDRIASTAKLHRCLTRILNDISQNYL